MKSIEKLLKLAAAAAAIAGIAFLVVKYMDQITEWLKNLCPCKDVPVAEEADIAARLFTEKYGIEVIDRTTPALSAEAMQQQNTLQGHFVRRAMKEIANATPQERPILEEALRLGLKALKEARL